MKKLQAVFLLFIMIILATGCGQSDTTTKEIKKSEKIVIQAPSAPPTAPLIKLVEDKMLEGSVDEGNIEFIIYQNVEEATTRVARGEADFTVLPVNVISKLYNKEADISLLNVNTWGILYLLSRDGEVKSWEDLKGKDLFVGAQGASPDVITRYLLNKNGIKEDEINISYGTSPEMLQWMIAGKADTVVLPEPLVTQGLTKAENMQIAMDYSKEWEKINGEGSKLPQTGIAVRTSFASEYPDAVEAFQNAYKEALEAVVNDPASVSSLIEEKLEIPAAVFEKSMERTKLEFVPAQEAKKDVETYLNALNEISGDMIGGKLPDEPFYYKK
ncbi:ABC transporter substrate-binding protein [Defluviitalea saccharophila]|uniref:ABC transporter substrate-binding protein n=1 Tax=Defluviitalea saccharophila TaxID=879970 RepID=A0ABZ2Y033_9FIRM|nr:ABC transporter substrate-binding protein [Candidatus Epulonipiscium sp.]